jgi:electron transfer flavoprotein beta subunit
MRIAVCLKRVPATDGNIRLAPGGRDLDFSLSDWVLNPADECALETALRAREETAASPDGGARLLALSVGGDESEKILRQALAVGADEALLVRAPDLDARAAARAAAAALKPLAPALVFCGRSAADDGQGLFPAALAEALDAAQVTAACAFEFSPDRRRILCRRRVEDGEELIEAALPAVVSCDRMPFELRTPALKARLDSKKRPVAVKTPAELGLDAAALAAALKLHCYDLPPVRKPKRIITGPPREAARELVRILRAEGKLSAR